MSPNELKPEISRHSSRFGCGGILFLLVCLLFAGTAYLLRPRWGAIWQAATGPAEKSLSSSGLAHGKKVLYYSCSMHPRYHSDKPGTCPQCGMELTPVYEEGAGAQADVPHQRKILYWVDPMNPQHRSDKPGKAPDGMDLAPVFEEAAGGGKEPPQGTFRISMEKQQLIGVQFGEAAIVPLSKSIRATAKLAYDESRIVRVHSRVAGWIEHVYADFAGELVKKGQPLLTVYSPEIVATQEEYLLALKAGDQLGSSPFKEVATGAGTLLEAARRRLELWSMSEGQIAQLEKSRKVLNEIAIYAPADGFVLNRNAFERQRIMPETELYAIADLTRVWAIADIYEFEAPFVSVGQQIRMTLPAFPGKTFRGRVSYIYPQVDNVSRTLKVRTEFPNADLSLKPDMYADIELNVNFAKTLSVPAESVLDSGSEQFVFVVHEEGYFEARKIKVGSKTEDRIVVLSGLKPGERVVTAGNFLVDAESRLKSALGGVSAH